MGSVPALFWKTLTAAVSKEEFKTRHTRSCLSAPVAQGVGLLVQSSEVAGSILMSPTQFSASVPEVET